MSESDNLQEHENDADESGSGEENSPETPLCLRCMKPVDPGGYYCENCGEASNGLTQYIPFVNIQWGAGMYGKMCRQVWSKDVSIFGKLVRLLLLVLFYPFLLLFLPFIRKQKDVEVNDEKQKLQSDDEV